MYNYDIYLKSLYYVEISKIQYYSICFHQNGQYRLYLLSLYIISLQEGSLSLEGKCSAAERSQAHGATSTESLAGTEEITNVNSYYFVGACVLIAF